MYKFFNQLKIATIVVLFLLIYGIASVAIDIISFFAKHL